CWSSSGCRDAGTSRSSTPPVTPAWPHARAMYGTEPRGATPFSSTLHTAWRGVGRAWYSPRSSPRPAASHRSRRRPPPSPSTSSPSSHVEPASNCSLVTVMPVLHRCHRPPPLPGPLPHLPRAKTAPPQTRSVLVLVLVLVLDPETLPCREGCLVLVLDPDR